jgi:hypothetical protein
MPLGANARDGIFCAFLTSRRRGGSLDAESQVVGFMVSHVLYTRQPPDCDRSMPPLRDAPSEPAAFAAARDK